MDEKVQNEPLSRVELQLEIDATTGEGAAFIDSFEDMAAAKKALFDNTRNIMQGEGGSTDENAALVNALIAEVADTMVNTAKAVDPDERVELIARLMESNIQDLIDFIGQYETEITIRRPESELLRSSVAEDYENLDDDSFYARIHGAIGGIYADTYNILIGYAADNKHDQRQQKYEKLKLKVTQASKEVGKIALGATVAVVATRFLNRK